MIDKPRLAAALQQIADGVIEAGKALAPDEDWMEPPREEPLEMNADECRGVVALAVKKEWAVEFEYVVTEDVTDPPLGRDPQYGARFVKPQKFDVETFGGWDYHREAYRAFRYDRMRRVEPVEAPPTPPEGDSG